MYLMIPELILSSKKIDPDEKIVLSYFFTLYKSGKKVYAKPEYLENLLGLNNVADTLENLGNRNYICSTLEGKELSIHVIKALEGGQKK
jgi:hypothetical protein